MKKYVVIINGKGGVGKDTLCQVIGEKYAVENISSITPIKEIAKIGGWKGTKEDKDRKFLADLKKLFIEYNDLPFLYLKQQMEKFLKDNKKILFVHIREIEEIKKFLEYAKEKEVFCRTLSIVKKEEETKIYGNEADDNVKEYVYDVVYENNMPLKKVKEDFMLFFEKNIIEEK